VFKALTRSGEEIFAPYAERKKDYFCPFCKNRVRLKAGQLVIRHFYHLPGAECPYRNESYDHLKMKQKIFDVYQTKFPLQVEKQVISGRRADVLINADKPIVVECQVSPITVEEWEERTRDYNKLGIYVFWIFHLKRLKLDSFKKVEKRIPAEILHAHRHYYGRVYIMDSSGSIKACKLSTVSRDAEYEAEGLYYSYTLKRTRYTSFYTAYRAFRYFENKGLLLAGLKDDIPRKKKRYQYTP
jgi:competence CoiA-like predicted nuclease